MKGNRWVTRGLLALIALVTVLAVFSLWAARQLLDTDYWEETNTELIQDPVIRDSIAVFLVDQLYENVNVQAELAGRLPEQFQQLAGPLAGALRTAAERVTKRALATPQFQSLWAGAVTVTHEQLIKLIEDKGDVIKLPGGGEVYLDLRPLLGKVSERVGLPASVSDKIPPDAGHIKIASANQVEAAQTGVKWLKRLTVFFVLLLPALIALTVYLAEGRRRETVLHAAYVVGAAALVILIARRALGNSLVDSLTATEAGKEPASHAYAITTSILQHLGRVLLALAIILALGAWLAGPGRWAVSLRGRLRPTLAERPDVVYGVVFGGLVLLLLAGIVPGIEKPLGAFFLLLTAVVSVELVRRQAVTEARAP